MSKKSNDWAMAIKLAEGVCKFAIIAVYVYSVYLGFCSGWLKGLFMLLVPVIAQAWLFFEEWICNPCGFSSPYVTYVVLTLILVMIAGILQEVAKQKDMSSKSGMLIFAAGLVVLGVYRFESINKGASSPTDVACAYVRATMEMDVSMAKYYSGRSMQNTFDFLEKCDREGGFPADFKRELLKESKRTKLRAEEMPSIRFDSRPVMVFGIYNGMEIARWLIDLTKENGEWKVTNGSVFEESWKELLSNSRNLK